MGNKRMALIELSKSDVLEILKALSRVEKRMALIELSKSDVLEILKALSRVEGYLMAMPDTYHIAETLDWPTETLTKKLLGEQADVLY